MLLHIHSRCNSVKHESLKKNTTGIDIDQETIKGFAIISPRMKLELESDCFSQVTHALGQISITVWVMLY